MYNAAQLGRFRCSSFCNVNADVGSPCSKSCGNVQNLTAVGMVRASDSSLDWRYAIPFVNDLHNFPLLLCLAFYFLFVFNGYLQSCKCTRIHYYYNEVLCFVASAIMFSVTGITYSSLRQFRRHTHTHTHDCFAIHGMSRHKKQRMCPA